MILDMPHDGVQGLPVNSLDQRVNMLFIESRVLKRFTIESESTSFEHLLVLSALKIIIIIIASLIKSAHCWLFEI